MFGPGNDVLELFLSVYPDAYWETYRSTILELDCWYAADGDYFNWMPLFSCVLLLMYDPVYGLKLDSSWALYPFALPVLAKDWTCFLFKKFIYFKFYLIFYNIKINFILKPKKYVYLNNQKKIRFKLLFIITIFIK